ncbi:MAG: right-handed parallel beta-helix repeat-containing protein [Planctomycetes bacterium]|nr:right-handed parallel beta-helix repeat-containing protein [Planctomycetota bacterium]
MNSRWITFCLLAVCLAAPAEGAKLKVPGDYATIQAAVNAAGAGDVIEVSQGTYLEKVSISGKDDLTLRAKNGHAVNIDAGGSGTPLSIATCSGITVRGLRLRHTSDSAGITIGLAGSILIKGCTVSDTAFAGISAALVSDVVIEECTVKNAAGDGIAGWMGMSVVRNTTVQNVGGSGILIVGYANTIEGNSIRNCAAQGIRLGNGADLCESCLVVENRVASAADGIYLDAKATGNSVLDNVVEDTTSDGIELQDGAEYSIVSGNAIRGAGTAGMDVDAGFCSLSENKVQKAAGAGFEVEANASSCLFFKNKAAHAGEDGFSVGGSPNTFVENRASHSGGHDLDDDTAPGSNVYLGNKFKTIAP